MMPSTARVGAMLAPLLPTPYRPTAADREAAAVEREESAAADALIDTAPPALHGPLVEYSRATARLADIILRFGEESPLAIDARRDVNRAGERLAPLFT
jgi:hypothetical protein